MSVLKYKNAQGVWEEVTDINQIITVEVDKPVVNGAWKEIEVTMVDNEFDCSAANIDLLDSDNWILCGAKPHAYEGSFYPVADSKPQGIFITPIIARLKGADMSNNAERIGIYTLRIDGYGYGQDSYGEGWIGSALFKAQGNAVAMEQGTHTDGDFRVYSNYIRTDGTWTSTAKLIYLDNEED